ncbi:hypothetical protein BBJ28_00005578 [Nothophytophthora sp. Chile5]|nr:hypothetical protein BBJ28_00005578 [Nothophytophthora sp. Chile5]
MASLDAQIKTATKQVKTAQRAISARDKKVIAANKVIAEKTMLLARRHEEMDAKKKRLARSEATRQLLDSERMGIQEALEQETRRREHIQQAESTLEMTAEELLSACSTMDSDIRRAEETLATMEKDASMAETAVKNRVDEIRDKFLDVFVLDDCDNLLELLSTKFQGLAQQETDQFEEYAAAFTIRANSVSYASNRSDSRSFRCANAVMRAKHDKILRQKELHYHVKVEALRARKAEKRARTKIPLLKEVSASNCRIDGKPVEVSSQQIAAPGTNLEPEVDSDRENAFQNQEHEAENNPPWLSRQTNENVDDKVLWL